MNLLALMPKLKPEFIKMLAENAKVPVGSVPLLRLEDALDILGYNPKERENVIKEPCPCQVCNNGGLVLLRAWRDQHAKPNNNPGSV